MPREQTLPEIKIPRALKKKLSKFLTAPNPFLVQIEQAARDADKARREALEMLSVVSASIKELKQQIKNSGTYFIEW